MLDTFAPIQVRPDHKTFFIALLAAVLAHVSLLAWFRFDLPQTPYRAPTLSLTLLPLQPAKTRPSPTRQHPIEAVTTLPPKHDDEAAFTPVSQRPEDRPVQTDSLLERSLEATRKQDFSVKPSFRSFSTLDFPGKASEPNYQRPSEIRQLVTTPGRLEFRDSQGFYTIKTTDWRGNVVCMQERGFAGDGNPPLWYRIPADTCGHIQ